MLTKLLNYLRETLFRQFNYHDGLPDIEDVEPLDCVARGDTSFCQCEDCLDLNDGKETWV